MNIIELCKQAGLIVGTNISGVTLVGSRMGNLPTIAHITIEEMERLARIVRNAALEEAAKVIERHRIPVGNSAAGEMACEMTYDALKHIRHEIRAMKEQT